MGWCTTSDLDRFAAAAGGYLRSGRPRTPCCCLPRRPRGPARACAAAGRQPSAAGPGLLFGWWEPPDGGDPRGAFVHDPAAPLLISGRAPEMAAALAATLAKMGRQVSGVDAPTETADAFAAAWSQRAGTTVRAHRNCRVYRLTDVPRGTPQGMPALPGTGAWPARDARPGRQAPRRDRRRPGSARRVAHGVRGRGGRADRLAVRPGRRPDQLRRRRLLGGPAQSEPISGRPLTTCRSRISGMSPRSGNPTISRWRSRPSPGRSPEPSGSPRSTPCRNAAAAATPSR